MTRVRAPAAEAAVVREEGCSLLLGERGPRDGGRCQAFGGVVLHAAQLHGLRALWGAGRWAWDGGQWAVAVGVEGDVVQLFGEGHQGLEVLAVAAVEVHLRLDVGFEAPHEGAPLLSCAQVRDLQQQLVEGGDVMGHRAGLVDGREPVAHYVSHSQRAFAAAHHLGEADTSGPATAAALPHTAWLAGETGGQGPSVGRGHSLDGSSAVSGGKHAVYWSSAPRGAAVPPCRPACSYAYRRPRIRPPASKVGTAGTAAHRP